MTYLLRVFLIFLVIFLIVRNFIRAGETTARKTDTVSDKKTKSRTVRGVPKSLGEYIDYEEVNEE